MRKMTISFAHRPSRRHLGLRLFVSVTMGVVTALITSCSSQFVVNAAEKIQPSLTGKDFTTFDGDRLGYQKWVPKGEAKSSVTTVIIGVHGISGYSGDYENLGKHLTNGRADTVLYAAEIRGQGMDPVADHRGDIRKATEWYRDLYTFTGLVHHLYPKAKIVWFGESMGSMIITHAYNQALPGERKPDALVISSPIVGVKDQLPPWKFAMARAAATLFPKLRVSLETLSDGQKAMVTEDDIHDEQAAKNAWYIRRYTLRLLLTLGNMSDSFDDQATTVDCPVLLLHGGLDIFTPREKVDQLFMSFPSSPGKTKRFYPDSYHLLMYDHHREEIFDDVDRWIQKLKKDNSR